MHETDDGMIVRQTGNKLLLMQDTEAWLQAPSVNLGEWE